MRILIKWSLLVVLVLSLFLGMGSQLMAAQTWKIGHVCVPEPDNPYHATALKFKELVEGGTNGRIKFQIFPQRQLGDDREMLEGVQAGLIEMQLATLGPATTFGGCEVVDVLEIPFLFKNFEHLEAVIDGPIGRKLLDKFEKGEFKALGFGLDGIAKFTSNRPLHSAKDFEGLQLRTMPSPTKVATAKALGANPIVVPYAELYSALQTGVVDAQSNAHWVTVARCLWEVQKYVSCTNHCYGGNVLVVNLEKFNSLSSDDQELFLDAGLKACQYGRWMGRKAEDGHLLTSIKKGMIVDFNPDTESMRKATESVYEDIYKKHPDWEPIIKEIKQLGKKF